MTTKPKREVFASTMHTCGNEWRQVRRPVFKWWTVGWSAAIQLGFSFCLRSPNLELHVPFGFMRVGWVREPEIVGACNCEPSYFQYAESGA